MGGSEAKVTDNGGVGQFARQLQQLRQLRTIDPSDFSTPSYLPKDPNGMAKARCQQIGTSEPLGETAQTPSRFDLHSESPV